MERQLQQDPEDLITGKNSEKEFMRNQYEIFLIFCNTIKSIIKSIDNITAQIPDSHIQHVITIHHMKILQILLPRQVFIVATGTIKYYD